MRLTIALLVLFTMQAQATGHAQEITLVKRNAHLADVFKAIERQTDYTFFFDRRLLADMPPVSVRLVKASLAHSLAECLKDRGLTYSIVKNTIVIREIKRPVENEIPSANEEIPIPPGEVRGRVLDRDGQPLQGVSVFLSGTQTGTTTDSDGRFVLVYPDEKKTIRLEFSSIGFETKSVETSGSGEISVVLDAADSELSDVVVVGYGTQKKSDLTGSVTSVSEADLQSMPVPSVAGAMQGRASGVQISQTGGNLSGRFSINIRGAGTVTSNNDPLIVVDGVPLATGTSLDFINPKDITAIDILKDASATAIFGARASNGVVIVSTRRGAAGKAVFSFNTDIGVEKISKFYEVLTSEQQRQLFLAAFKNTNRSTAAFEDPNDPVWQVNNNWQKMATRSAVRQNYYFTASGGSQNNRFLVSGGYLKREGVVRNSDITEYYLRANNDITLSNSFKISSNLTANHSIENALFNDVFNSGGNFEGLVSAHSYTPAYDENGNLTAAPNSADPFFGNVSNPLINILLPVRLRKSTRLLGNVKADLEIVEGLVLSGNMGADLVSGNNYNYDPIFRAGVTGRDEGNTNNSGGQSINWVTDATLKYQRDFNHHSINTLVGVSAQQFSDVNFGATGTGTTNNLLDQLSNQTVFNANGSSVSAGLVSSFARVNYGYDDRYLMTATVRRDGSSKFGQERRYGVFPSASAAWRVSQEKFFNVAAISDLKFRISYGLTGNQNIPNFAFITRAGASRYAFGNDVVTGYSALNIGNPLLQWESAKQFDIGIDISLFGGRIHSAIDFYNKRSDNLLVQVPLPITAGVPENPTINLGSVENRGVEFSISSRNLVGTFKWNTDFNISFNKNKVINIGTNSIGEPLQIQGMTLALPQDFANITLAGQPIGSFYMYDFIGIWQLGEEDKAAASGAVPGDPRYADLNNNGILDAGDKSFHGSPQPAYFGGFNNTFSYGNFSLTAFVGFAGGHKLYNSMRNLNARAVPFNQQMAEVADFWTPTNPSKTIPRPSQGGNTTFLATRISTRFLEDASYLRLRNLSLSYSIPPARLQRLYLQGAQISIAATNLFTITNYSGLDPEFSSAGSLISGGLDLTPYPPTRYYYASLALTF